MKYQVVSVEYVPGSSTVYSHHILKDEQGFTHCIDLMLTGQFNRCVHPRELVGLFVKIDTLTTFLSIARGINICY